MYDPGGEHWKLRAQISEIRSDIERYVEAFDPTNLITPNLKGYDTVSDIIWFLKGVQ
jgi:hypothetical protein